MEAPLQQETGKVEERNIMPGTYAAHARVVTNDLGLEDAQQDHNKCVEKKQKEAAKHAQRAAKQKEDLVR
jgi:hypothetical protein